MVVCCDEQRKDNKCVQESTFYSLAQYFAIILFECAEADDFTPAKILMNMCFTYYHVPQINQHHQESSNMDTKIYLSTVLRDQPIWRSIRFWNAAFFDAVQYERENFIQNSSSSGLTTNAHDNWQFQANLTFGQLGYVRFRCSNNRTDQPFLPPRTFTYNMHAFNLPKQLCLQFLAKQSTIANLTPGKKRSIVQVETAILFLLEQMNLLQDNIERMYKSKSSNWQMFCDTSLQTLLLPSIQSS